MWVGVVGLVVTLAVLLLPLVLPVATVLLLALLSVVAVLVAGVGAVIAEVAVIFLRACVVCNKDKSRLERTTTTRTMCT